MTAIDWAIVIFVAALLPLGYRQGFVVGALTLGGFALGALVGGRLGPLLLTGGSDSPYAPATALLGGLALGGLLAALLEGVAISVRERLVRGRALGAADAVAGAAVTGVLALAIAWVIGAVALNAPALEDYRKDVQRSAILSALNETFPPSGPLLNVLNRIEPTPTLRGPNADVAAPRRRILSDPELQAAAQSVVRVLGTACGLNVSGSGWVAAPELVVTNAHVVAGEDETTIRTRDGSELAATATVYRPRDDIAVLRVPGLGLEPLTLADSPRSGTQGAVAGFPGSGEFALAAARLGTTGTVQSQDSYGRGPIEREMTSFRADVERGNSGGPMVDGRGRVLTTVFASALGRGPAEGLGVPNAVTRRALGRVGGPTDTGPCAA
jgi:S1-C subfamily serine protease